MFVKIVPFKPEYANDFKTLNIAWLEKFFSVETKDALLLEHCQKSIIEKGGYIYFAECRQKRVGCFALIPIRHNVFELGKMAVDPKSQGKKIGQRLVQFAISLAKKNNWDKIILYSSTKLISALYIYRKYGFRQVTLEDENPYNRSDIKMELVLLEQNV